MGGGEEIKGREEEEREAERPVDMWIKIQLWFAMTPTVLPH